MFGVVGFSFRELAIAVPAAVMLATLLKEPRRPAIWAVAAAVGAGCAMLSWVKLTLPGQSVSGGVGAGIFNQIFVIIPTISLVLLPATLLCLRSGIGSWKRSHVIVGVELGAIVVAFHLLRWFSEPARSRPCSSTT